MECELFLVVVYGDQHRHGFMDVMKQSFNAWTWRDCFQTRPVLRVVKAETLVGCGTKPYCCQGSGDGRI